MAKPQPQQQQQQKTETPRALPTVTYLRMAKQEGTADKWDLFEGVATCLPETEKKLETGFGLLEIRYAYDVAKAKRLHKRQGDAK